MSHLATCLTHQQHLQLGFDYRLVVFDSEFYQRKLIGIAELNQGLWDKNNEEVDHLTSTSFSNCSMRIISNIEQREL